MARNLNVGKMWDRLCGGVDPGHSEERAVIIMRNMLRVAMDDKHKDYAVLAKFCVDHMLGRPTQKVELSTPQGIQVDASAGVLAMMGVKSITGTFVNAEGESEEMRLEVETEALDG